MIFQGAYIYCKSSRGNLPTETLAKLLAIQRKLLLRNSSIHSLSPVGRAIEAAKAQLIAVNRKWLTLGPRAFGALGEIGSASSDDARIAWTKATDGKVTVFDDGSGRGGIAIDAGRVVGPAAPLQEAPPMYVGPPEDSPLTEVSNVPVPETAVREGAGGEVVEDIGGSDNAVKEDNVVKTAASEFDVEAGRQTLARLRAARELKDAEDKAKQAAAVAREHEVTTDPTMGV
ncbi:hypothetical protein P7C70_g2831, partial [Phenoliferia sp. Uapishka_3]